MIIGHGAKKLERRITTTINNSALTAKELSFLAAILHRIERYGDQAFITDAQASWLYTILTRGESGASGTTIRKPSRSSHPRTFRSALNGLPPSLPSRSLTSAIRKMRNPMASTSPRP